MTTASGLETAEELHARVAAATDDDGRLSVAVEEMPGWDIFEHDILRIKPLHPLAAQEPERRGENPEDCWCAESEVPERIGANVVWSNERWLITLDHQSARRSAEDAVVISGGCPDPMTPVEGSSATPSADRCHLLTHVGHRDQQLRAPLARSTVLGVRTRPAHVSAVLRLVPVRPRPRPGGEHALAARE